MKLIHISDLHLDSVFGDYPLEKAIIRRSELLGAFSRALEYGKSIGAAFCLICGDLFDNKRVGKGVRENVLATMEASPMKLILLKGNHDDGVFNRYEADQLPKNVIFLNSGESVCLEGLKITSAPTVPDAVNTLQLINDAESVQILLAHGEIGEGRNAINPKWFTESNIAYLALGHYHSYACGAIGVNGTWAYSGCLEGRGFDETGEKGLIEITVEGKSLTHRFVKMSKRMTHDLSISIDGTKNDEERVILAENNLKNIPCEDCVRLTLSGTCNDIDAAYIEERLRRMFFYLKLKDSTAHPPETYAKNSLKEEFVREVGFLGCTAEAKDLIMRYGLAALGGDKIEI